MSLFERTPDGQTTDMTPPPFNARTRVHEYGGAAFVVSDGTVYFSNFEDQQLYRQTPGSEPQSITPEANLRYADGLVDSKRNRLICVREDRTDTENEAVNALVSIPLDETEDQQVLVSGNDFYSSPRLNPDGTGLAWMTWHHPNMPWDGAELWVGEINADGSLGPTECVAGGVDESIFQPEWSPDGTLHFVSDRTKLVESLPLSGWDRRAAMRDGGGVWETAVDIRHVHLSICLHQSDYLYVHTGRCLASSKFGHRDTKPRSD